MNQIPKEEFINIYSYDNLCDYVFDDKNQEPSNGNIVFLQLENFPDFEEHCKCTENRYIVVSPRSDLGISEQEKEHPNADLVKKSHLIDWKHVADRRDAYLKITLGPCAETNKCRLEHKYSIKFHSGTLSTFQEVPENITKWFCCNVNVQHPKIVPIPFGIPDNSPIELMEQLWHRPKRKLLYVNFQENTIERQYLNQHFSGCSWATTQFSILPREQYLKEMAEHQFVLCPFGNGRDSYRIYEALYMGCIPIVQDSIFASSLFYNMPVLTIPNYFHLNEINLARFYMQVAHVPTTLDSVFLSYWKNRICSHGQSVYPSTNALIRGR